MPTNPIGSIVDPRNMQLREVRRFFAIQGEVVLSATMMLGGPAAQRRCLALQSHLAEAHDLTRQAKLELVDLHKLLMLVRVGDPDTVETQLFSEIHPDHPVVEDLCLLADRLYDLLLRIDAMSDDDNLQVAIIQDQNAA